MGGSRWSAAGRWLRQGRLSLSCVIRYLDPGAVLRGFPGGHDANRCGKWKAPANVGVLSFVTRERSRDLHDN